MRISPAIFCFLAMCASSAQSGPPPRPSSLSESSDFEEVYGPTRARVSAISEGATAKDPKENGLFRAAFKVEIAEKEGYATRFTVHLPERSFAPIGKKAGRYLALLWGMANRRFGRECARLRDSGIDVWLTASGEAGGEQVNTNLYIYNVNSDRSGIEWARELAHEYGHYLLPGASGYTNPESWSNGLLGERLFLSWLLDDLNSSRIDADEVPFVKEADLADYCAKQAEPLIDQIRNSGADRALLQRMDNQGMNALSGLLLYADSTYGSASLMRILEFVPRNKTGKLRAIDFLDGLINWLSQAEQFIVVIPGKRKVRVLLPGGKLFYSMRLGRLYDGSERKRTPTVRDCEFMFGSYSKPTWAATTVADQPWATFEFQRDAQR
jgi:hypothetical protein